MAKYNGLQDIQDPCIYYVFTRRVLSSRIIQRKSMFTGARFIRILIESPEELEMAPQPAIGFWLFHIESLDRLASEEELHDHQD